MCVNAPRLYTCIHIMKLFHGQKYNLQSMHCFPFQYALIYTCKFEKAMQGDNLFCGKMSIRLLAGCWSPFPDRLKTLYFNILNISCLSIRVVIYCIHAHHDINADIWRMQLFPKSPVYAGSRHIKRVPYFTHAQGYLFHVHVFHWHIIHLQLCTDKKVNLF